VCLYDSSGNLQPLQDAALAPGGTCGTAACWKLLGKVATPKGYKYKNKPGNPDGLTDAKLQAGLVGKAKVQVKGKGVKLTMPALGLTPPVTVQLLINDGVTTTCWQTTFPSTAVQVNTPAQFKAKGP
jgi:NAD(P)H-dependent flavin oxidoreductase YrpB (nitropropane dioxygenase family)